MVCPMVRTVSGLRSVSTHPLLSAKHSEAVRGIFTFRIANVSYVQNVIQRSCAKLQVTSQVQRKRNAELQSGPNCVQVRCLKGSGRDLNVEEELGGSFKAKGKKNKFGSIVVSKSKNFDSVDVTVLGGGQIEEQNWVEGTSSGRLLLQPQKQLAPRVEHILVKETAPVLDIVVDALNLPRSYVADLIRFGAVHKAKLAPPPPPNLPPHVLELYTRFASQHFPSSLTSTLPVLEAGGASSPPPHPPPPRSATTLTRQEVFDRVEKKFLLAPEERRRRKRKKGGKVDGEGMDGERGGGAGGGGGGEDQKRQRERERQKIKRVGGEEEWVEKGGYLRVHVHPRRFPACYSVDWTKQIIIETNDFVVVDKPPQVSVNGCVDNQMESCAVFAAQALGLSEPLMVTHQLDTCTQGCVVMAKTKAFASFFNVLLQERIVEKTYKALTASRAPVGPLVHYMMPDKFPPRILSTEAVRGWLRCELEILSVEEVPWPSAEAMSAANVADCDWPEKSTAYECVVRLVTGRTHQLRAQLASIGAPLVGDTMYLPPVISRNLSQKLRDERGEADVILEETCGGVALKEAGLGEEFSTVFGLTKYRNNSEVNAEKYLYGIPPNGAIGLQAWRVFWDEQIGAFESGPPWWRYELDAPSI